MIINLIIRSLVIIIIMIFYLVSGVMAFGPPGPPTEKEISITNLVTEFGTITIGDSSDQTIRISNIGPTPLLIREIASIDPLSDQFRIISIQDPEICENTPFIIPAFGSCIFTVRFKPVSAEIFSDTLNIESDDSNESTVTIIVKGTGSVVPVPDITVTDSVDPFDDHEIRFGQIPIGSQSDETITIRNNGDRDLQIIDIAQVNPISAPFSIINNSCLTNMIAPSGSCTFTVRYEPVLANAGDSFIITTNDPDDGTVTLTLSGFGISIPVPDITVTDTFGDTGDLTIDFTEVAINTSNDAIVQIMNNGFAELIISVIAINNYLEAPISIPIETDSCTNKSLEPTKICTFIVNFSPSSLSAWNDSFDILSNDDPVTITVSGRTTDPTLPLVSPIDGMTGVGSTANFIWEDSSDVDSDPDRYNLTICENPELTSNCIPQTNIALAKHKSIYYAGFGSGFMFIGVIFAGNLRGKRKIALLIAIIIASTMFLASCGSEGGGSSNDSGSPNTPSGTMTQIVSGMKSGTEYFWKVEADNGNGDLSESAVWSFTTQ